MPTTTGIWSVEEALEHHDFSYKLAKFIGDFLPKDDVIIDWGCGRGTLLRYLHDRGFSSLHGVEGTNFPAFEFGNIAIQDLTQPIVKDTIGHSICLEVGEHIPKFYEIEFLKNLSLNTACGSKLILSWAIPGQDGIGHVNCMHNIEVIELMNILGFNLDFKNTLEIRQHVDNHTAYFRNTLMIFDKR